MLSPRSDPTPPPDSLVAVRHPDPDPDHIHLIIQAGADITSITAALAALPDDAFYLDHGGDPSHLLIVFRRLPPAVVAAVPPGWTPPTPTGHPPVNPADQAVAAVTAGLLLGQYDSDIVRPPRMGTRPTVLTIVRLVRLRANSLSRPHSRPPESRPA